MNQTVGAIAALVFVCSPAVLVLLGVAGVLFGWYPWEPLMGMAVILLVLMFA